MAVSASSAKSITNWWRRSRGRWRRRRVQKGRWVPIMMIWNSQDRMITVIVMVMEVTLMVVTVMAVMFLNKSMIILREPIQTFYSLLRVDKLTHMKKMNKMALKVLRNHLEWCFTKTSHRCSIQPRSNLKETKRFNYCRSPNTPKASQKILSRPDSSQHAMTLQGYAKCSMQKRWELWNSF